MIRLAAVVLFIAAAAVAVAEEQPAVTLDVKDEDVRSILQSMQKQCGIKNLVIDPDVRGAGTIYFRQVPCETAFHTVFRQFSLKGQVEQNMVVVEPRSH